MTAKDWGFAASLLVNVMCIAFIATTLFRGPQGTMIAAPAGAPFDRLGAIEDLPSEERAMVRGMIREAIPDLRRQRRDSRSAFFDMQDAISGEPFDPDAVRAAADRLAAARQAQWRAAADVYVDVLAAMSDEARASVIESREESARELRQQRQNRFSPATPDESP